MVLFRFTHAHEELVRKGLAALQEEAGPSPEASQAPVPVPSSQSSEEPLSQEPPVKSKRTYTRCVFFYHNFEFILLCFLGRNCRRQVCLSLPKIKKRIQRKGPLGRKLQLRWSMSSRSKPRKTRRNPSPKGLRVARKNSEIYRSNL